MLFLTSCLTALPALAQEARNDDKRWAFVIAAGELNVTRRDETASPLRFGGDGFLGSAAIERTSQRYRFQATVFGASTQLHTSATVSKEQYSVGELDLALVRSVHAGNGVRLNAGLTVNTSYEDAFHRFDVEGVPSTTYRLAMVTAEPVFGVEISRRIATLHVQGSVPLFGLVDHPFSDVKNGNAPIDVKFRTLNTLRAVNSLVSVTTNNAQPIHLRAAFRASALSFLDDQPVHAVRNSLMLGIVLGRSAHTK